jgi:hypothetical protein
MLSTNMAPLTSILDVITSTAIYTRQERKKKFNLIIYFLQSLKDKFVPTSMLTCTQVDILVSKMCKNQMEVNNIGSLN